MRAQNQLDPVWWTTGEFHRRPMLAILRDRDFTSVFNFLRTRGASGRGKIRVGGQLGPAVRT
jgi:hypothetical protein